MIKRGSQALIVAAARTPITPAHSGGLAQLRTDSLAAAAGAHVLAQVPNLPASQLDDLYLGCALPGGQQGFNLARVVAVLLGLDGLPGAVVTRYCASSFQAIRTAVHAIAAGEGDAFLVIGAESSSSFIYGTNDSTPHTKNPVFRDAMRRTALTPGGVWTDPRAYGALPDLYIDVNLAAEYVASTYGVSRRDQDACAYECHRRALESVKSAAFEKEIIHIADDDGNAVADECPREKTSPEALAALPPLRPGGTVTAGNCCRLADGAAAALIVSQNFARQYELPVLARVRSTAVVAMSPEMMALGAVGATQRALRNAAMSVSDVDLFEVNEEYAVQLIVTRRLLGVNESQVNIRGGAIGLGHPYGMTGVRMLCTLLGCLDDRKSTVGVVSTPAGGGQGMAVVVERVR